MKNFIICISLFCSCSIIAQDQEHEQAPENFKVSYFDFTINLSSPIGNFGEKLDRNMIGFSAAYLKQRKDNRLDFFGLQLNYMHLGAIDQVFAEFEERTGTNLVNLQAVYRYFPNYFFWRIEPFVEAGLGPQLVYSVTTSTFFDDGSSDLNFEDSDFGLSYYVSIGFTLHIAESVLFVAKTGFNSSTSMTYEVPQEYMGGLPFENFRPETSPLDFIHNQFGISYIF